MRAREGGGLRCEIGGDEVLAHIVRLYGEGALGALRGYTPMYCSGAFTEVYLLHARLLEAVETILASGRVPYFAGLYAGRLRSARPKFIPSHLVIERVYRHLGRPVRAVRALERGIKAILYGRDLLAESASSCYEPVEEGEVLAVIGPDDYVYAIGVSRVAGCDGVAELKRTEAVAQSVFDLGWYLRGGTVPREAKYRQPADS